MDRLTRQPTMRQAHAFLPVDQREKLIKQADARIYRAVLDEWSGR